jgi:glycosyltransferase involved in cell wall biosynthesis
MKISTVVITYNEERNIARCLESVKDISDEIIVVDSYSTDKTVEIAESFGAKVLLKKFEGHIEQKSWAIEQAGLDYIISLDADEALDKTLQIYISKLKLTENPYDGYIFNRLTNFCGKWIKHCGWYPDRKLRLFRKELVKVVGTNPHDKFVLPQGSRIQKVGRGDIQHFSYYSIEEHISQIQKFSNIAAESAYKRRKKAPLLLKIIGNPIYTFFKKYILQLGFLDGYFGYVISFNTAFSKFLKYSKLRELHDRDLEQKGKEF